MTAQIIHLSSKQIFQKYFDIICSSRFLFSPGTILLELTGVSEIETGILKNFFKEEKNIFFVRRNSSNIIFINETLPVIDEILKKIPPGEITDKINKTINNYLNFYSISYSIGKKEFNFNSCYVMGILNVTPDSFSDGGLYLNIDDAVNHALEMISDGADIIDVGGESTRPGSEVIDEKEEMKRVIPVIKKILSAEPGAIISIDTTKSKVAAEAVKYGAKIINDISGATFDEDMLSTAYRSQAALILMHIKGTPKTMQQNPFYENVMEEIYNFLTERTGEAEAAGVEKIFIDPGIGFGKRLQDNFEILNRLEDLKSLGYPIVIGASRKSFLGKKLNLDITERDTATAVAESIAVKNGARIIRTHNVSFGRQVCELVNNLT